MPRGRPRNQVRTGQPDETHFRKGDEFVVGDELFGIASAQRQLKRPHRLGVVILPRRRPRMRRDDGRRVQDQAVLRRAFGWNGGGATPPSRQHDHFVALGTVFRAGVAEANFHPPDFLGLEIQTVDGVDVELPRLGEEIHEWVQPVAGAAADDQNPRAVSRRHLHARPRRNFRHAVCRRLFGLQPLGAVIAGHQEPRRQQQPSGRILAGELPKSENEGDQAQHAEQRPANQGEHDHFDGNGHDGVSLANAVKACWPAATIVQIRVNKARSGGF